MSETPENNRGWRIARRILIALAVLATLIAVFYTEEDWRGKHAWEKCKTEMEAKGVVMDWNKYIPPAISDDENIFKAPKMREWFVGRGESELTKKLRSTNLELTASIGSTNNLISTLELAQKYLAWSDQFAPDFKLISEALKRPTARMDGDYTRPFEIPIPNFLTIRAVAQVLGQRAHCYFLLNQPDKALDELTLLHDLRGVLQPPPNGKPETLVAAMINVAVVGLYANTIEEGFQRNIWQEPQLVALQKQLSDTDLLPWVFEAFQTEPAAVCYSAQIVPPAEWANLGTDHKATWKSRLLWWFWPRGWTYQNMVTVFQLAERRWRDFDPANETFSPKALDQAFTDTSKFLSRKTPYNVLAVIAVPNFLKANQVTAHNQAMLNEAQIVCALERYKLANGNYPKTLDAIVPQFIAQIPHDIIGGQPLHYQRTIDGKFLLYSVGWNETDDGGVDSSEIKNASSLYADGDWVWKN